jgi:hypothetical protein
LARDSRLSSPRAVAEFVRSASSHLAMKIASLILLLLTATFVSHAGDTNTVEESWFPHIDGIFSKAEYIDLNTNATERLYIRYGPISDSGVELERSRGDVVVWRVHVRPLGVVHSKYRHDVRIRIDDGKIQVTSIGAQQIFEVRDLKTGAFISRKVEDVRR